MLNSKYRTYGRGLFINSIILIMDQKSSFVKLLKTPWNIFKLMINKKDKPRITAMPDNKTDSQKIPVVSPESPHDELIRKAEEELQEKPEWRDRDIQALRDMVLEDKALEARTDDAFLLRFLRARKFDYDRAFHLLKQYYRLRNDYHEMYSNFRPSAVMNAFQNNMQTVLPQRDQNGRSVFIYRPGKWDPSTCTLDEIFIANQLCLEMAIEQEETQINGIVMITDWKDFGIHHAKHVRPALAKKVLTLIQDCFPARFKSFHAVNDHSIFETIFMLIKPFLSDKIKDRIYFHGENFESLHKHVTPEILPEEFGGLQPPMDNSNFVQTLLKCDEKFVEDSKYGYKNLPEEYSDSKEMDLSNGVVGNYYRKICMD